MQRKVILKIFIFFTIFGKLCISFKNSRKKTSKRNPLDFFMGSWDVLDPDPLIPMSIYFDENQQIYLNDQLMNGNLVSIKENELIFKDHFGYELIVTKLSTDSLNLFDEADEKNYRLIKQTD
ncbi:DUF4828 domain-containing protein [Carnobacterium sp.]|uniref:DUF4828 domain-containing protein n=1 Tax=Carnobacterium sp. TaxID=48221 RepID=UPI0028AFE796|nr:DUF4828 domain-containing protein [Carnobacterium sp.]